MFCRDKSTPIITSRRAQDSCSRRNAARQSLQNHSFKKSYLKLVQNNRRRKKRNKISVNKKKKSTVQNL